MVLKIDDYSEIGAHRRSNLCNLIRLRHYIRSGVVTNRFFFFEKNYFPSCLRNMSLVTIECTMYLHSVPVNILKDINMMAKYPHQTYIRW